MREVWKDIEGWEGKYQISSYGRCKSFVHPSKHLKAGYILKEYKKMGYVAYSIGPGNRKYAHSLVLETFVGPRPKGYESAHLDGSRTNNKLSNLKWTSCAENNSHKKLHGTSYQGEKHFWCKYSDKEILKWEKLLSKIKNKAAVARHFNVSKWAVYSIFRGKTRKYLGVNK